MRERLICVMNHTSSIDFTQFIAFFNVQNDTPNSLQDDLRERSGIEPTTVPKSSLLATFALLSFLSFSFSKTVLVLLYYALLFSFLSIPLRSPLYVVKILHFSQCAKPLLHKLVVTLTLLSLLLFCSQLLSHWG